MMESPGMDWSPMTGGGFDTPEPTVDEVEGLSETLQPTRFAQSLASVKCGEGDLVMLRAKITGFPKPRITWLKNGTRLQSPSARLALLYDGEWIAFRIRQATPENSGHYTIVAENTVGQRTCSATLTSVDHSFHKHHAKSLSQPNILSATHRRVVFPIRAYSPQRELDTDHGSLGPHFTVGSPDKIIKEGQLVRFDCRVSGRPYPEVSWLRNGQPICDDFTHEIIVNESGEHFLMITHASPDDTGNHTVSRKTTPPRPRSNLA